jgi:hypothetical protein
VEIGDVELGSWVPFTSPLHQMWRHGGFLSIWSVCLAPDLVCLLALIDVSGYRALFSLFTVLCSACSLCFVCAAACKPLVDGAECKPPVHGALKERRASSGRSELKQ